jgi:hypothetical protein
MPDGYLLVIKDDASKYMLLWETMLADDHSVVRALLHWFSLFGVAYYCYWVTDQGSYFKNTVIADLQYQLGAKHHFTTARCPWVNGTVENAMKQVLRVFRVLLSEWKMESKRWRELVPLVQLIYNQAPAASLKGLAPVQVMKGLAVMSPLDSIAVLGRIEPTTLAAVLQLRKLEFEKLQAALDGMHQETAIVAETKRRQGRASRTTSTPLAQLEPDDFVLYMDLWAGPPAKLRMRWKGPAMVVKANSSWVCEIQNLITGLVKEAQASCLKFYVDKDLEVSGDLLAHVAHNDQGYEVKAFGDARWNEVKQVYEIAVKWRGLDEASWEPAQNLFEDLPGP